MEKIAEETEEDYQQLIRLLKSFNVDVIRLTHNSQDLQLAKHGYKIPLMVPRDYGAVIGTNLYADLNTVAKGYKGCKDPSWPDVVTLSDFENLDIAIKQECINDHDVLPTGFDTAIQSISSQYENVYSGLFNSFQIDSANITRLGKDLYFGVSPDMHESWIQNQAQIQEHFAEYRCHYVPTLGHSDSTYCPVVPGLIIGLHDIPSYAESFPDWEIVHLPDQSWAQVEDFLKLKRKNGGRWWVPGEENNDDFNDMVDRWMSHWVGFVEETVFDVNMLVIDEHNVIVNNYNKKVFQAFERYGITPHICNFRHRYFWDGGIHCITLDLARRGTLKDYFPERN